MAIRKSISLKKKLGFWIQKAKKENLPSNNIDRLLKKLAGGEGADELEEVTYEGYGPGGVAIIVEAATDNRNRTAAEVRLCFNKNEGSLGETGCVAWSFDQRGKLLVPAEGIDEEELFLAASEAGALDIGEEEETDFLFVLTERNDLHEVRTKLEESGLEIEDSQFVMIPQTNIEPSARDAIHCLRLTDALEDCDDVQQVFSNIELTDQLMAEIEDQI